MARTKQMDKETKQLTIRLDMKTINDLDEIVVRIQRESPSGVVINRTDALRTAIIQGLESLKSRNPKRR